MQARGASILSAFNRIGFFTTIYQVFILALIKLGIKKAISVKNVGQVFLRKNTSDISVYRQIFFDGEYDIYLTEEPKIIVDLGGNIGLFALLMQSRYPGALIISVEPDPNNFSQLKKNTSRFKNIHAYRKAVWHRKELLSLSEKKAGAEWSQNVSSMTDDDSNLEKIESITINDLMNDHDLQNIDFLKIDIEGAEAELFSENTEWLNKVKVMAIELHDFMKLNSSNNFFKAMAKYPSFKHSISGENIIIKFDKMPS